LFSRKGRFRVVSTMLEIICPAWPAVAGLVERHVHWGGESLPVDPREFSFRSVRAWLVPVPAHVRAALPLELRETNECLELDQRALQSWRTAAGSPVAPEDMRVIEDLRRMIEELGARGPCAVYFEDSQKDGTIIERVPPARLFSRVDEAVRGILRVGLLIAFSDALPEQV
jgi:hypothetical protein